MKILRGFTIIEVLVTIAALGIASGVSIPLYRQYLVRNDLEIARQNVSQGIERARFLSQVGMNDSSWGFSTDSVPGRGVVFMGSSFATRDTDFDEMYSIPTTISVNGVTEVSFSQVDGIPNTTGDVVLTSITNEQRRVTISIGDEGIISIPEDWLSVCYDPYGPNQQTIQIPDSLWEVYQDRGSIIGDCSQITTNSSASSSTSSYPSFFTIDGKEVVPHVDYTCAIEVVGIDLENGTYDLPVTMQLKEGTDWGEPFGDMNKPSTGNINTGQTASYTCDPDLISANKPMNIRIQSWEKKKSWYSGSSDSHWSSFIYLNSITGMPKTEHVLVLKNGDPIPNYQAFSNASTVKSYLSSYVDFNNNQMVMSGNEVLYLTELSTEDLTDGYEADFQDVVLKLTLYPDL